ncbi:F-box/FBD/LRR-repeat protein At5g56420-like [Arabidopsis lyrata subsp. lyrata]|uniref:F-box/FBD/LRR-repeat protein At5g56420-like n=1 Tax=Arabidopsis lyrata subsp. lyrata TaxID=81972 RepID=UPI000A29C9E8|nr:F-box/FBD/LRR-repeat protein At5g56420-like [Arabidopsis lyrata subsp. lyrata]|eukprot:XP_020877313.1 F-box/FBD/LRR-repeat protein At5g56420-like [Arabidopsis lyrata subsp. lyrata]
MLKLKRDLSHFVYGTLLYHKAPVLETFHLNVASDRLALEVDLWIRIAVERFVRDLKISFNYDHGLIRLPSSFFRCETLETLELHRVVLLEVPSRFSFRSLRTLRLRSVKYSDEELFCRIISCCPVLEDLDVESCNNDNVATFTVNVPSLRSLTVRNSLLECRPDNHLFVIHSHSLKLLSILDYCGEVSIIGNMPELVEANLQTLSRHENVLKSLNSIRRLSLCLDVEAQYPTGSVFFQLVRLELCMCIENWSNMFVCVLQQSPKLQILKLAVNHWMAVDRKGGWIQPSFVPECLLLNIKTFEWRDYEGREEEKQMAMYILKNARRLLTATIDLDSVKLSRRLKVIEELVFASRGSRACKLTVC